MAHNPPKPAPLGPGFHWKKGPAGHWVKTANKVPTPTGAASRGPDGPLGDAGERRDAALADAEGMPIDPGTGVTYPSGSGLGPEDPGFVPGPEDTSVIPDEWGQLPGTPGYGIDPNPAEGRDVYGRPAGHPDWGVDFTPDDTGGGGGGGAGAIFVPRKDAKNTIKAILDSYDLGSLADLLYNNYAAELVDIDNPDAVIFSIKNEEAYKTRFSGNALRISRSAALGGPLPELSPGSYVALEKYYRQVMTANGLPTGFYDEPSDFAQLIGGDVSAEEFQSRVNDGIMQVRNADQTVKQQMMELYGVSDDALVAYFIDPKKALPLLKQQAQAARIAGRGQELAGIGGAANKGLFENLVQRGISETDAAAGFTEVGKLGELRTNLAGEGNISTEQQVGGALGYDVQAQKDLEARKRRRLSEFSGGGSFTRTQGETSGGIGLSVGQAQ